MYFGPLTKQVIDRSVEPHYINFSNDRTLGAKGLCSLEILSLPEGDD